MSDRTHQLLSAARQGDLSAQATLMQTYESYLRLLASLQINDVLQARVSASDIVQDVFLKANQGFAKFRGQTEKELVAWLRSILASQLASVARRHLALRRDARLDVRYETAVRASSEALSACFTAHTDTPSQQVAQREDDVLLADALDKLPGDYREIIVLRHFQGVSFEDIAARMSRSVPGVKSAWMRAVTRLRALLGQEDSP